MSVLKEIVIMGAGPAGLAAGYELGRSNIPCVIFEAESQVGGISRTIEHNGCYFDLGGHRFFTKFGEVDALWREILGCDFRKTPRLSRIYYNNRFFNYPLTAVNALMGVGPADTLSILFSYFKSRVLPSEKEDTFEEWVSNRFGKKLYSMFFKTYTEKVWGIPCSSIQAEWAAQRIKGLSLKTAVMNAIIKPRNTDIKTLIDEFDYPVRGPGMMYGAMKDRIESMGGNVRMNSRVVSVNHEDYYVKSIEYIDAEGKRQLHKGTDFVSSIPVTELINSMNPLPEAGVLEAAGRLSYRSVITVDIIVNKKEIFPDNWIYIHSPEVRLGRVQNFKNWSAAMVPGPDITTLGLEYFCTEGDDFWNLPDEDLFRLAASEAERLAFCRSSEITDHVTVRVPKAYPVYMMGYRQHVDVIKEYLKRFKNLQLIGRYGLFKYNNMDHSILTGLYAARNIAAGTPVHDTWEVNTDGEYQEEARREGAGGERQGSGKVGEQGAGA